VRDGQRRDDVQPADDADDERGGDGGRHEPAAGDVHRHGNGAGVTVRRRTGSANGDGRRTVGDGRRRGTHIVPRHTRVQAGHGLRGVRIAPAGGCAGGRRLVVTSGSGRGV